MTVPFFAFRISRGEREPISRSRSKFGNFLVRISQLSSPPFHLIWGRLLHNRKDGTPLHGGLFERHATKETHGRSVQRKELGTGGVARKPG